MNQRTNQLYFFGSVTNRVGKFYKPPSNGLCNDQLAFGNLQLA
jgi:hypothetical protein